MTGWTLPYRPPWIPFPWISHGPHWISHGPPWISRGPHWIAHGPHWNSHGPHGPQPLPMPPARRSTLIFVHVQQRVLSPVLLAVLFSVTALTLVPAFSTSCWGRVDSQMSNLPIFLSLTLSATVMAIL